MELISCAFLLLLFQGIACIYFTEKRPVVCLNSDANVGTTLGRLFAHSSVLDNCSSGELMYDVSGGSGSVSVNNSGWLQLAKTIPTANKGNAMSLEITAKCTAKDGSVRQANTTVTVKIRQPISPGNSLTANQLEELCYGGSSDAFFVEENINGVIIGTINQCSGGNGIAKIYKINKPKAKFSIDPITSTVRLLRPLDRESGKTANITGIQPLRVTCTVTSGNVTYPAQRRTLNVTVLDVNDSPPVFANYDNVQYLERSIEIYEETQSVPNIDEVVVDNDSYHNNSHTILVTSDPKSICKAETVCMNPNLGKTICRFLIQFENLDKLSEPLYRCEVRLADGAFVSRPGGKFNNSATIVANIQKRSALSPEPTRRIITERREVSRDATRFSRVVQLASSAEDGVIYSLFHSIFKVTKKLGIVYVDNPAFLETAPANMTLVVHGPSATDIHLQIYLIGSARKQDDCDAGCSRHDNTAACIASCGFGLDSGNCVMRGSDTNWLMDPNYGTCTHSIATCPDRICDELEDTFTSLCPQDCTTEVNGAFLLNTKFSPPRGIVRAQSPCWCDADDLGVICTCMPGHNDPIDESPADTATNASAPVIATEHMKTTQTTTNDSANVLVYNVLGNVLAKTLTDSEGTSTAFYNNTAPGQLIAVANEESTTSCDNACATAIGLGSGAFIAISFSLFMLWFTKKKNDRRKSNMKHVGSVVSMTAVPSDYYDEGDRRVSYSSPQWTPKGPVYTTQSQSTVQPRPEISKWEVPRDSLILDQTLGEGEFGLVVKAKALGMDGEHTEKHVAVKMLKHCSTAAEEQDLWSEFNLLKDVSHPNVIRLLGVCTGDGPFYVIVEYCEHGCLLKYLRRSRLEENGYVNQRIRYRYQSPNEKEQTNPNLTGELLTMRDLLSFAWQIAKGMSYLSGIKLVHRDLAARNVLVSSGRMLKISDFGLTRDVYEADTYLKKSRGRIPVKWLAPESLYAQIYTTKSDVWSYGIVLWEIVTLGAPPYPGIPPERLYNLLIGGYRMDRPENCPDEMYAVMQKCWKTDAADRPTFSNLAEIFDRILQEKTGYLDLSSIGGRNDLYGRCFSSMSEEGDWTSEHSNATDSLSDSDKIDDMTLTTVCNNTYLTPACVNNDSNSTPLLNKESNYTPMFNKDSNSTPLLNNIGDDVVGSSLNKRKFNNKENSEKFFRNIRDLANNTPKQSRGGNLVHPSENVALLKDSGRVKFVNLPDSTEDENTRVTLEC